MGTFFGFLVFPTLCYLDLLLGLIPTSFWNVLHLLNDIVAFKYLAEDYVFAIEPAMNRVNNARFADWKEARVPRDSCRDEELRTIGVFARVGHAEHASLAVLQLEVLVREFRSIDRLSSGA